jgi:hypothetical protein
VKILLSRNFLFGLRVLSPVTSANFACSSFTFIVASFAICFFVFVLMVLSFIVMPARTRRAGGFPSSLPVREMLEGLQLDRFRVDMDEALPALAIYGLDVDAVLGGDAAEPRELLLVVHEEAVRVGVGVGPRGNSRRADGEALDFKVLPLSMEADLVAKLDEARERLGLKSRMELLRRSIHLFLAREGEAEVAALFAPEA